MQKILLLILLSLSSTFSLPATDDGYETCSIYGVTHMRDFALRDSVASCFQVGPRVLYDSPWVKVSTHTYMDEKTMTVDWLSTKVFVEFFSDIYGLPSALFSSDVLLCNCSVGCMTSSNTVVPIGVDGSVELLVRQDGESSVAYLYYRRANITLFIRKISQGFNIGFRIPEELTYGVSGACVTGCQRSADHEEFKCFEDDYIKPSVDICTSLLGDLQPLYGDSDLFNKKVIMPCSHDVFIWKNASAVLDHRYAAIDEVLITDFDSILSRYDDLFRPPTWSWVDYDSEIDSMVRKCMPEYFEDSSSVPTDSSSSPLVQTPSVSVLEPTPSVSMRIGKTHHAKTNKTKSRISDDLTVPTTPILTQPSSPSPSPVKIDLTNDQFIDMSGSDDVKTRPTELPLEWRLKCEKLRTNKLGLFYLPYPTNLTMFIQCDETNRAFLKTCPIGTFFTTKMVCEKVDDTKTKLNNLLLNSKTPLPVKISMDTTFTPSATMDVQNPCSDLMRMRKIYFFPYPNDSTKFIQCDDFNKMTIGSCVPGTRFSLSSRSCEKF